MAKKKRRAKTVGQVVGVGYGHGAPHPPPQSVKPPAGYYDPALDAALGAAQRGYGYQQADYARDFGSDGAGGRAFNDYQLNLGHLTQGRDNALADIGTGETRATEDHTTALANLALQYQRLGRQQSEGDRRAGVTSGGLLAQQQQIRAANKSRDQKPIDTAFNRQMADYSTGRTRVGQDFDWNSGQLGLGYQRGQEDASTALSRAGVETNQFGIDTQASRYAQATQAGYVPPGAGPTFRPPGKKAKRAKTVGKPMFGAGAF